MEDAATAEISRTQVWQWLKHGATLTREDGSSVDVTESLVRDIFAEEMEAIKRDLGTFAFGTGRFNAAHSLFLDLVTRDVCPDFLTTEAYPLLETPR